MGDTSGILTEVVYIFFVVLEKALHFPNKDFYGVLLNVY